MSFFVGNVSPVVLTLLHKSHYLIILFFFLFYRICGTSTYDCPNAVVGGGPQEL
jgi:hypothetical protein